MVHYIVRERGKRMNCTLCGNQTQLFKTINEMKYLKCKQCKAIMLDKVSYLSKEAEKERYEEHNNDVEDLGYQKFVSPIVSAVLKDYTKDHKGLDFGAGTGPVITKLLRDQGYNIKTYDPFFANKPERLEEKYDYIVCCEVIEHFYNPAKEFKLLRSLLKLGGTLYLKTNIYHKDIVFESWYYKDDATHVFFYSKESLEWIRESYNFSTLEMSKDMIILGGK